MKKENPKKNGERRSLQIRAPENSSPPRISTNALMKGGKRLVIEHNDEDYMLQITRSGRLILTK